MNIFTDHYNRSMYVTYNQELLLHSLNNKIIYLLMHDYYMIINFDSNKEPNLICSLMIFNLYIIQTLLLHNYTVTNSHVYDIRNGLQIHTVMVTTYVHVNTG